MPSFARLLLVATCLFVGCAGTVGAPNDALRPPGKGWMCTRDAADGTGALCMREPARCEKLRSALANEGIQTSPCTPQSTAWCYTFVENQEARPVCYPIEDDCHDAVKASLDRDSRSNVSSCAQWD